MKEGGLKHTAMAVRAQPDRTVFRYHYAVALERNGKLQAVRKALEDLLTRNGDFPEKNDAKQSAKRS